MYAIMLLKEHSHEYEKKLRRQVDFRRRKLTPLRSVPRCALPSVGSFNMGYGVTGLADPSPKLASGQLPISPERYTKVHCNNH